jgi:uncharacterized surface protein with fasciclin (FAS1) repeats
MFDQKDLRGYLLYDCKKEKEHLLYDCKQEIEKKEKECSNSLMGIISKNPDFSKFKYIVELGKLEGILNDPQADFTLFIPSDRALRSLGSLGSLGSNGDDVFVNMDYATARHIVKGSMLDRKIPKELIQDSPASYFITKDPPNRLFVRNISGRTYIGNEINVIHFDIQASNGIIHVVDKMIWTEVI